ncbi:hypothetical protein M501DRAFT_910422, partial [Patellaria atrata CBS 101060]
GAKPTFGARAKRHCSRFWWAWLIVFAIVVLVVVLPIIYVAYPNIAQRDTNRSTLEIVEQQTLDPKPNSIRMVMHSKAYNPGDHHPQFDAFNASLFLEDTLPDIKPFGYITIPPVKANAEADIYVDQVMEIVDMEQWTAFNKRVVLSEELRLAIRGKPKLKQGGLPKTTVNYNKVTTIKGLNGLKGLELANTPRILLIPEDDGSNMLGNISIPNPSVFDITLGNVTLDLSVDGQPIGTSLIPNMRLRQGDNIFEMRAKANQSIVLGLIRGGPYSNGILPVDVLGREVVNEDGDRLPYFEAALKAHALRLDVNVGEAL